jgi:hypothetical protein
MPLAGPQDRHRAGVDAPMKRLPIALAAAALAALPAAATAQDQPQPLTGEGENFEIIGTLNIPEGTGKDIELYGDHAFVSFGGGLVIADISNPAKPKRLSSIDCGGGHDITLSPDGRIAYLASDSNLGDCASGGGTAIIDVSDRTRPKFLSAIETPEGSHTVTVANNILSSNNYASDAVRLYDVSDPRNPKELFTGATPGPSAFHDAFFDFRPDGRVLLYGASGEGHDIFDATDPKNLKHLQRVTDPEVSFSHQLEPNHNRSVLIASDEWQGGGTAGACGQQPGQAPIAGVPVIGAASDLGAYSFYRAAEDGTFSSPLTGGEKLGTFNIPFEAPQTGGCTSHVFWTAPSEDRLMAAWYVKGAKLIDFSDPAAAKEIGWFVPEGSDMWSAKPHRGLIFTGDLARGMDVLRYTGEGWPKNSPPAEEQRMAWHGLGPVSPATPGTTPQQPAQPATKPQSQRRFGTFRARTALKKVPGKKGKRTKLTVTFLDAGFAAVGKATVRVKAGRKATLRMTGTAETGAYRFVVRAGRKQLKRGGFKVAERKGASLPAGTVIRARVR